MDPRNQIARASTLIGTNFQDFPQIKPRNNLVPYRFSRGAKPIVCELILHLPATKPLHTSADIPQVTCFLTSQSADEVNRSSAFCAAHCLRLRRHPGSVGLSRESAPCGSKLRPTIVVGSYFTHPNDCMSQIAAVATLWFLQAALRSSCRSCCACEWRSSNPKKVCFVRKVAVHRVFASWP